MTGKFKFLRIFLGCIVLFSIHHSCALDVLSEDLLKIELDEELKKGNFLIGLKQYLGGKNDNFSNNNIISFKSKNDFITLHSFNGIRHKAKEFDIIWKEIPTATPYISRKIVFGPFSSYESAQKKAINLKEQGFQAIVTYPKNWEVWTPFENNLPRDQVKYKIIKKIHNTQITPFLSNEYTLKKLEGPIYLSSNKDIKINSIDYGKKFFLAKDSYGTWTLIQKIKFEDYLEGVLPHEIGSNSPLEALKAQAVIARTWGIYNSQRFSMDQYHLCITTQCQVYRPPYSQNKKIKNAIKATSKLIIKSQNKPINSFYHGSNGGISAMASESWEIEDETYFNVKIDGSIKVKNFPKIPIKSQFELNNFLDYDTKNFYGSNHSFFRWKREISSSNIEELLIENKLIDTQNKILDLNVIDRGSSGRVTKLEIKMIKSNQSIILTKDDIRRILSFLPSNLFTINKLNDNFWLFKGGGFGHGVGLSQSGAIEMAKLGFTYEQILHHDSQGTRLEKIEILAQ